MARAAASDHDSSPFHSGERAVQQRLGVREQSERGGRRMIRDFMLDEHRDFFELLPFLLVGSLDSAGRPWASLLSGEPGFVTSPNPHSLMIASTPVAGDPLLQNLRPGAPLGVLGIQLETRRRNRANGRVVWSGEHGFELAVEQSFGNCKMYVQARTRGEPRRARVDASAPVLLGSVLTPRAVELLQGSDTAFLATSSAHAAAGSKVSWRGREGVDVSHRGGLPGFLRVEQRTEATRITLPDYAGNNMFNSLGNIEVSPRAGLLCCDFSSGDLLSLSGAARVLWDSPELARYPGAERLLEIDVEAHVLLCEALAEAWSRPEYSPQL